jgi:hypothetical protein
VSSYITSVISLKAKGEWTPYPQRLRIRISQTKGLPANLILQGIIVFIYCEDTIFPSYLWHLFKILYILAQKKNAM